jgi:hypothetical protein
MPKMSDSELALERALVAFFHPISITVVQHVARSWACATLQGVRHILVISPMEQGIFAEKLRRLSHHEFALCGHLVADIVASEHDGLGCFEIEALIIEEPRRVS